MDNYFKLSDADLEKVIDSLDETGGFLIKERELRYWIEYFVNNDRCTDSQQASRVDRVKACEHLNRLFEGSNICGDCGCMIIPSGNSLLTI